jgi:glycerophosphoryl diester phosphodiesterase
VTSFREAYLALPRPTLFGHRGCRGEAPENTLAAFEVAARGGADGIEIDVRPCKDGALVVVHDPTLERTAGDPRSVADLTLADLAALRNEGERIPTLEETLEFCRRNHLALNVELKRDVPSRRRAVIAAARALLRHRPSRGIIVSSFDPLMLVGFRALAPEIPTALLLEPDSARRYRHERLAPYLGVAVHPDRAMVTPERIARWHGASLKVAVWTVNEPEEIRRLCELGVDGLISDKPREARSWIDEALAVRR